MKATCIVKDMPRCSNNTNIFQADLPSWRSSFSCLRRYDLTFRVNSSIRWMFSMHLGHQIRTQHPGGFPDSKFTNQFPSQRGARRRLETTMKFELWRLFEVLAALAVFFVYTKWRWCFSLKPQKLMIQLTKSSPYLHIMGESGFYVHQHYRTWGDPVTKAGWWFHPVNGPAWTPDENGSIRPNW